MTTFTVILFLGIVGMLCYTVVHSKKYSLTMMQAFLFTISLTLTGVAGAKLMFAAENLFQSWGGVSFFGAVFLIPLLMPLIGLLFRLSFSQSLDLCAPCVAIMITCLRINCMISGCCGGWQVCWGDWCFNWPTQAIESIADIAIFLLLLRNELSGKGKRKGLLYPLFMLEYSTVRFFLEFLRATPKDWLFMSHGQWFSIVSIIISIGWMLVSKRKQTTNVKVSDN